MDELTRDELQAGAEQLERMSVAQFEQFFGSLFVEDTFDQTTDALLIDVSFDPNYGIDTLHYDHVRADGTAVLSREAGESEDLDLELVASETWQLREQAAAGDGITSLTLAHPVATTLTSARLMQGMYDAFIAVLTSAQPSLYLTSPQLQVELYQHESQPLDVTTIHGEQWTCPDLSPPPEKQLEYVPDWELPAELSQIDVNQPLLGLTCARQPDECERCESKPLGLSGTEERQFIDQQLRQHRIPDGDAVRAVAVIARCRHDNAEEWMFEDLYHWECALPEETFHEDYTARRSVGKDEVLLEGRVTYGEKQSHPVGDYHEVTLSDIEILARQGTAVRRLPSF